MILKLFYLIRFYRKLSSIIQIINKLLTLFLIFYIYHIIKINVKSFIFFILRSLIFFRYNFGSFDKEYFSISAQK